MSRAEEVLDAVAGKYISATGWVRGKCPFCPLRTGSASSHQTLGLEVATGWWLCHRCGARGLIQDVPEDLLDRLPVAKEPSTPVASIELPKGFVPLYERTRAVPFDFLLQDARDYLEQDRGFAPGVLRAAGVGAVLQDEPGAKPRLAGRVVVPIYDATGRTLAGWSARDWVGQARIKVLYPEGMNRRELLFNATALARETTDPVFVVEAVFDALALWPDAVGCLGKPTAPQLEQIAATKRPVVVALDGDAWRESEGLALQLAALGCRAGWLRFPPGEDPASMPGFAREQAPKALERGCFWREEVA